MFQVREMPLSLTQSDCVLLRPKRSGDLRNGENGIETIWEEVRQVI